MSCPGVAPRARAAACWTWSRNRYLLSLIVRKEVQVRYRGSILGILWSYIKPAAQFVVFYVAMGVFLGLNRGVENYAVYLFSGIVVMNFFNEAFGNAARSIVGNGHLIKKIYLPRELFPVSSAVGRGGALRPAGGGAAGGLPVVRLAAGPAPGGADRARLRASSPLFSLGLGLLFTTANVFFRDAENIVDLIAMVATWASPGALHVDDGARRPCPPWMLEPVPAQPADGGRGAVPLRLLGAHRAWWPTRQGLGDAAAPVHRLDADRPGGVRCCCWCSGTGCSGATRASSRRSCDG